MSCHQLFIEQMFEQKMRSLAVMIPLQTLDVPHNPHRFQDENRFIPSPEAVHEEVHVRNNFWTAPEKYTFTEKYLQQPKKFGYVSDFLILKVNIPYHWPTAYIDILVPTPRVLI